MAVLAGVLLALPPPAHAVVNAATGGVGGIDNGTLVGGDGTGEARLELFGVDLALVKQARDLSGTVLPDGAVVSPGQEIYFVLYVDNPTAVSVADFRLTDLLNEQQFSYVPGSLEQTVVPTGSNDATIWAGPWTPQTDAVGAPDDGASVTDTGGPSGADRVTVGTEPVQTNQQVGIPALSLRAFRLRVVVN